MRENQLWNIWNKIIEMSFEQFFLNVSLKDELIICCLFQILGAYLQKVASRNIL